MAWVQAGCINEDSEQDELDKQMKQEMNNVTPFSFTFNWGSDEIVI